MRYKVIYYYMKSLFCINIGVLTETSIFVLLFLHFINFGMLYFVFEPTYFLIFLWIFLLLIGCSEVWLVSFIIFLIIFNFHNCHNTGHSIQQLQNIHSSQAHTDHYLGHKTSLNKFKTEFTRLKSSVFLTTMDWN